MKKIFIAVWLLLGVLSVTTLIPTSIPSTVVASTDTITETESVASGMVYMFGRDTCGFCQKQKEFMTSAGITYTYLNITESAEAKALYDQVVEKHGLSKVTPITVVGERVFLGYNSDITTGRDIEAAIQSAKEGTVVTVEDHLVQAPAQSVAFGGGCSDIGCTAATESYVFDLPLLGVVDLKSFSLFSLSLILGTIDGFNPCAMWVLITFLMLLAQAGSRQKMLFLAGLFIVAEAIMYNLILNVWYKTWDFVALDEIVTPLVGILALSGGTFFLYRWRRSKATALVCDITDLDSQTKTIGKLKAVINQPLTITTVLAIIVIAFSVNVIEFACSIGIPQAYTKILDLNMLTFMERQWYILVYTFGYMIDDFVVFGLAIWGFTRLEAHGAKYARLSLLIGGILMVLLGLMLVFNPDLLVL